MMLAVFLCQVRIQISVSALFCASTNFPSQLLSSLKASILRQLRHFKLIV